MAVGWPEMPLGHGGWDRGILRTGMCNLRGLQDLEEGFNRDGKLRENGRGNLRGVEPRYKKGLGRNRVWLRCARGR